MRAFLVLELYPSALSISASYKSCSLAHQGHYQPHQDPSGSVLPAHALTVLPKGNLERFSVFFFPQEYCVVFSWSSFLP